MNSLPLLLASVALLLPGIAPERSAPVEQPARAAPESDVLRLAGMPEPAPAFDILEQSREVPVQNQVRIEQRVIIRIAPSSPDGRRAMAAQQPRVSTASRYKEERVRGCIPIEGIVGVQPVNQNRLLLFMRDRRVLSASLERRCNAQDFYLGAYVERSEDGQLCSRREQLQSRTGATCQVSQLNRLVAVRD